MNLLIMCVDQGVTSGYAAIASGQSKPLAWGVAKSADQRRAAVAAWLSMAALLQLQPWLVLEDHSSMPLVRGTRHDVRTRERGAAGSRSTASILGQGASAGRWKEQAESQGLPKSRIRGVTPEAWKRAVLGPRWPFAATDVVRAESVRWALALVGATVPHDAAAAIAMAAHQSIALPQSIAAARAASPGAL